MTVERDPANGSHVGGGGHVPPDDREWGSAFFGWSTATGTAVILTAILAGIDKAGLDH